MEQQQQNPNSYQAQQPQQPNVIIMGKAKSVGAAFVLAFFFGPLGLLYASVLGGIIMFVVGLILFFLIPVVGYIIAWVGCLIWAVVAANAANAKFREQANNMNRPR
ncbi:MAG TPA: hypothetical protein VKH37_03895 [Ferruginibacter sp.]|nr:hypothetical protein [Ferruginibacter sp.]